MKKGKSLLIIDDDAEFSEELADILRDEGYSVQIAADGCAGEKLLAQRRFNVVLLDYKMPGQSGVELLKKSAKHLSQSKVFFTSGRPFADQILKKQGLDALISGVFVKPFDIEQMLLQIGR